jgi:hypothetical protein
VAKCRRCGKGGLLFKVNVNGICKDCERIEKLESEETQLKLRIEQLTADCFQTEKSHKEKLESEENQSRSRKEKLESEETQLKLRIEQLTADYSQAEKSYKEITQNRDTLYTEIAEKAKSDTLAQISDHIEEQKRLQRSITSYANKLLRAQTLFKTAQYSTERRFFEEEVDDFLSTTVKLKFNLMDVRELRKRYNKNDKLIKEILKNYQSRYTTKSNMSIYRLMVIALEAELQNILYNLKYSKLDKSIKDIKAMTAKYQKIATDGNQNIAPTVIKFIGEIEYLFIEAVNIEYEYYIQKERIKEEQRAIREQMKQEAAERKRLEEERKKIEREEEKYKIEIDTITSQLSNAKDTALIKQLEDRIAKIQSQLNDVAQKKEHILKLEHGQAGHVYIISNLGSFGDEVFKIGMTRRLVPQDRIDELGGASVPFGFDVHSFIFSNNAPKLELELHKRLHNKRVNKINLRKEFFKTTINELEDMVYSLEPSAEFNQTMLAEQYYQSMAVDEIPESVNLIEDDDSEAEETDV